MNAWVPINSAIKEQARGIIQEISNILNYGQEQVICHRHCDVVTECYSLAGRRTVPLSVQIPSFRHFD